MSSRNVKANEAKIKTKKFNKKKSLAPITKPGSEEEVQTNAKTKGKGDWKKNRERQRPGKKPLTLIIKNQQGNKWFQLEVEKPESKTAEDPKPLSKEEMSTIEKRAEKLLEQDNSAYSTHCIQGEGRSDFLWMNKILKTGTLPDKMAAFIVRIQDSPVHGLQYLQQLISMVKPQGKQQCLMVSEWLWECFMTLHDMLLPDTVRDLFIEDLLPPDRKLKTFESRQSRLQNGSDKHLILWIFEDRLKTLYLTFVEAVRRMSTDQVEKLRGKGISIIEQLLTSHPEREDLLLQILVNKLGDPLKKIGSRALFHLNKVLVKHPQMKLVVVGEVERLLFRNNVSSRTRYYGICFLTGIYLKNTDTELASKLVKVYLAFFKACVKTGEIDSKLMGGLLTGVNHSFPIAKLVGYEFTESLDVLFKIVQLSQFSTSVQALALLFQITDNNPQGTDRFYRALYRKLVDSELAGTSHAMQFLNIIFKAMKKDTAIGRVKAFAKRLLQVCCSSPPNLVCAILFLVSEVAKTHQTILSLGENLKDVKDEIEVEPQDKHEGKISLRGKQLQGYKKVDLEHLAKTTNVRFDLKPEDSTTIDNEKMHDLVLEIPEDLSQKVEIKPGIEFGPKEYDPTARNPEFCGAETAIAYELMPLSHHFHPSVALFAQTLLNEECISYDGNPLKDFTVGRFLERFVYRNAKVNSYRQEYQPTGLRAVPVNSSTYLQIDEHNIPVEEKFFYKYFNEAKGKFGEPAIKKEDVDSDSESVGDEEFDDIMDNYFKNNGAVMSDEEDVDFMSDVQTKRTKKGKATSAEEDESDEEEGEEIDSEGSGNDDADEFIQMGSDDEPEFDTEDGEWDNDEDDGTGLRDDFDNDNSDGGEFSELKSKLKLPVSKRSKLKGLKSKGTFVPAEQFSEMLESNANIDFSGSNTFINEDNAGMKQIKWEENRDRWVKGYKRNQKSQFMNPSKKKKFK